VPVTGPADAVAQVLIEAGEPLHWTVVQDRALRAGLIDPFSTPDVRGTVQTALRTLVADGRAVKVATGTYEAAPES